MSHRVVPCDLSTFRACVYMCRVVGWPPFSIVMPTTAYLYFKVYIFCNNIFRVGIILIVPVCCTFAIGQSVYPSSHLYLQIEVETLPKYHSKR